MKSTNFIERLSNAVACSAGRPMAQAGFVALCAAWWIYSPPADVFTNLLSIAAIVLTQMVLSKQNQDAARDHEWQREVFAELLDKVPGARPEIAETDG